MAKNLQNLVVFLKNRPILLPTNSRDFCWVEKLGKFSAKIAISENFPFTPNLKNASINIYLSNTDSLRHNIILSQ